MAVSAKLTHLLPFVIILERRNNIVAHLFLMRRVVQSYISTYPELHLAHW